VRNNGGTVLDVSTVRNNGGTVLDVLEFCFTS